MSQASTPLDSHWASAAELKTQLDAERAGQPFLVFRGDDGGQRIVALSRDQRSLTIGRAPETDICLGWDLEVSRVHAELERVGPDWAIADDGLSRNGTFVNGERVAGRVRLRGGDLLRLAPRRSRSGPRGPRSRRRSRWPVPRRRSLSAAQRRVLVALCRPYRNNPGRAAPASNRQIAEELFLSVDGVKTQVRALFERFAVEDLPQNEKRARLVEHAFVCGAITDRDFED